MPKSGYTFRVSGDQVTYFGEEVVQGGGLTGILSQLGGETSLVFLHGVIKSKASQLAPGSSPPPKEDCALPQCID
jgi:hypothetical protein